MENILSTYGSRMILPEKKDDLMVQNESPGSQAGCMSDEECQFAVMSTVIVLRFTSMILVNATMKDVYKSLDVSSSSCCVFACICTPQIRIWGTVFVLLTYFY